jgi:hypothetical protein
VRESDRRCSEGGRAGPHIPSHCRLVDELRRGDEGRIQQQRRRQQVQQRSPAAAIAAFLISKKKPTAAVHTRKQNNQ